MFKEIPMEKIISGYKIIELSNAEMAGYFERAFNHPLVKKIICHAEKRLLNKRKTLSFNNIP